MISEPPPPSSNEREELLELIMSGEISEDNIDFHDLPAEMLSFAQRRLWFLNTLSGGADASYNVPFALRLCGILSVSALRAAFADIIARHDMLKAYFPIEGGEPVQRYAATVSLRIELIEADPTDVPVLVRNHACHIFALDCGPLIDVQLLRISEDHYILLLNLHHIIADGWSLGVIVRELSAFYRHHLLAEPISLPRAPKSYSEYAERQRRLLDSEEGKRQLDFWLRHLSGAPLLLDLSDGSRPARMSGEGGQVRFAISGELRDRLQVLSREHGATLFMTLMAVFTTLLHQVTGQEDILVGSPVAGRSDVELEEIVGCFVNTILIRSRSQPGDLFEEQLGRIRAAALAAYENQDLPFEVLVERLQPNRSLSYTPVFQVMMALQNIPIGSFSLPGLTIEPVFQELATAKFDLNLSMAERSDEIVGVLEYNTDIIEACRATILVEQFLSIVDKLAKHGFNQPMSQLSKKAEAPPSSATDHQTAYRAEPIGQAPDQLEFPREQAGQCGNSGSVRSSLPPALIDPLQNFSRKLGVNPEHVIIAAVAVLLFRLAHKSSFLLGFYPAPGRYDTQPWVGWHCDIAAEASFRQLAEDASEALRGALETYEGQALTPSDENLQSLPSFSASIGQNLDCAPSPSTSPLHFSIRLANDGIDISVDFGASIGTQSNAKRIVRMLGTLMSDLLESPNRPITKAQLLSDDERNHILHGLNVQRIEIVSENSLAEPFEARCALMPLAIALIGEDRVLTYHALDVSATQLANYLHLAGVKQGDCVGLFMERSVDLVVAIYAVAKAGAAYLPIDPALPNRRVEDLITEAGLDCIVTQTALSCRVIHFARQIIEIDGIGDALGTMPTKLIFQNHPSNGVAYVMYTSGSTGRPKAVQFPIDAAIMSIRWLQQQYPVAVGDHHLFKTPYGFDVSIWEIFWPLYYGGTLVVCDPDGHRDPVYLRKLIEKHNVTCVNFVPSLLQVVLDEWSPGSCASLRWVLSGGEALSAQLRDRCHALLPSATLVNLYGPTETHSVTDIVVPQDPGNGFVPLGRPSAAYRLYVLDEHREPVPIGVAGELYIGGDVGLAHGYLGQPGLTADRFLPDPYGSPGSRMYRSGDLCRYFADGVLEHLGRADRQVKIRGIRIEPAEIEAVLLSEAEVRSAVVAAIGEGADRQLVGFVTAAEGFSATKTLRRVAGRLPQYMVPAVVIQIPSIPLSTNGKVDYAELANIWAANAVNSFASGTDETMLSNTERRIKRLYEQVLVRTDIEIDQSFFEIGGHSMLTFRLMAACEEEFGIVLSMHALFTHDTIRSLAVEIETVQSSQRRSLVALSGDVASRQRVIFLIHGADGTIIPLRHLVAHLHGHFAVYSFQAPGLDGSSDMPRSVEAYAERYARAADQVVGSAKIVLIGWSFGGAIAVEMARIWSEQGLLVEATVLLDTFLLSQASTLRQDDAYAALEAIGFLDAVLAEQGVLFERLTSVLNANLAAFVRYIPQRFSNPVKLIKARRGFPNLGGRLLNDYQELARGWQSCLNDVAIHDVDADHFDMLSEDNAPILAKKLLNILRLDEQH